MNRQCKYGRDGGFTLVEILAVIAIVGFLTTIGLTAVGAFGSSAKDVKAKADLRTLRTAIDYHMVMTGSFPPQGSWGQLDSPLLTSGYDRMFDEWPEDPYNPGNTYRYLLRVSPGERSTYIAWSTKETATPVIYEADKVLVNGLTIYVTNARSIANDMSEVECRISRAPADLRSSFGNLLPFLLFVIFIGARRRKCRSL